MAKHEFSHHASFKSFLYKNYKVGEIRAAICSNGVLYQYIHGHPKAGTGVAFWNSKDNTGWVEVEETSS